MWAWYVFAINIGVVVVSGCSSDAPAEGNSGRRAVAADPAPTRAQAAEYRGAAVRYQVADVGRAVEFYTTRLGFEVSQRSGSAFAMVRNGDLTLWPSGPKSSGSRPMPDGTPQKPGGWNRVVLEVTDLPARIEALKGAGVSFRNRVETGPGGSQIQLDDPDGNPVELFQPAT